ncbi:MAG: transcriptional repressor LexA [Pseudomonadota bacterium]
MSQSLTRRQQEILDFIRDTIRRHGYPPTRNEIAVRFGFRSPNAAEDHLKALNRKGAIRLESGVSRGIRVIETNPQPEQSAGLDELPLVGRVAAGQPILAAEHIEEHCAVDPSLFRPRPHYLLRVHGSSMRDAGILDGDLLAVHRTPEAREGQIVVARLEDEVTVKRFHREGDRVQLLAENPDFAPIEVDLRETSLSIEGLGVGVIRSQL